MSLVRKILFPLSIVYDGITSLRNVLFNKGILKSTQFDFPVIVVGNLSVGGSGKTPQIEYLIRLLKDNYRVAVLSRGYKRSSKGFLLANENTNVSEMGDEPFQYYSKFRNILVAVDEDRVHGIRQLRKLDETPDIVLLDDAYQHRKVDSKFNILLTPYNDLYVDDFVLPTGNLRESKSGSKRAKIVVVTKCPDGLSDLEMVSIKEKLKLKETQKLFFSKVSYADVIRKENETIPLNSLKNYSILLITGIANPQPMIDFFKSKNLNFNHLKYSDHHNFSTREIDQIRKEFEDIPSEKKLIVTTEKDFMRLKEKLDIYYLEIEIDLFNESEKFNSLVNEYIESYR